MERSAGGERDASGALPGRDGGRGDALFVVDVVLSQQRVVAADAGSVRAGVRVGMSVAQARALVASRVRLVVHEATRDAAGLVRLARWAERWSPIVEVDGPDGLLLDVTGCEHLFKGEARLVRSMTRRLWSMGFTARVACASSVGVAWAVARYGRARVACVAVGEERGAIAGLPVRALRVDERAVAGLEEVGVRTIGELLRLPRSEVATRYGREVLAQIDRALGVQAEIVFRTASVPAYVASLEMPGGTSDWESVASGARVVLGDLCAQLGRSESGLRRLVARFDRVHDEAATIVVQVTRATRCEGHLWSLMRPRVERLDMGLGVEAITLEASVVSRMRHEQGGLGGGAMDERDAGSERALAGVLDTLVNRLGSDRVVRPVLLESHRPERAVVLRVMQGEDAEGEEVARPLVSPISSRPSLCRPTRLFEVPEPAGVMAVTPDGPIHRVRWRGEDHAVVACQGPERIGGEWWRGREGARDYFRVQTERGRWLWVVREGAGRGEGGATWRVHGVWA